MKVHCKCGREYRNEMELRMHLLLLKPSIPPQISKLHPWLSSEKAVALRKQYEKDILNFNIHHGDQL